MADIKVLKTERHTGAQATMVALTTAGKTLDFTGKDDKIAIILQNTGSSAVDVTVEAGNGLQGVTDIKVSVPAGIKVVRLDSGEFKKVSGDNKGCIVLKGTGVNAGAVELCE